jgi:hypothetical protein
MQMLLRRHVNPLRLMLDEGCIEENAEVMIELD